MEDLELDVTNDDNLTEVPKTTKKISKPTKRVKRIMDNTEDDGPVSCLTKEKIVVRYIPKESGMITNPKHVFYGGMAENATRSFTVPILESNGKYVNILTNDEKSFLEEYMGLEYNALSIYLKKDNFWENYYVKLTKNESYLDLSNPDDYIKYKVLLANSDYIACSLTELQDTPKVTYQYVLISENEETKQANKSLTSTMQAYMEFGKMQEDNDTLRVVIETLDGRAIAASSKTEFLQATANKLIQADPNLFLRVITDKLLPTKVLIKKSIEAGNITKRGDYLYLKQDNSPLCGDNQEPTLTMAAKYLNLPKKQEVKLMLEAKLK